MIRTYVWVGDVAGGETVIDVPLGCDIGAWLVEHRCEMERGEAIWLAHLAEFDIAHEWAADGHLSCVQWLMWHTKMARATAYEKLQVAHELRRRPVIAEAFAGGRLSYSAVRVLTRIEGPDRDVDLALVNLAEAGTVADLEKAVRHYQLIADQDRGLASPTPEPRLVRRPNLDGTTTIEVTLEDSEAEEIMGIVAAFADRCSRSADRQGPVDESAAADSAAADDGDADGDAGAGRSLDESAAADNGAGGGAVARRAYALLDMARTALAHLDGPSAAGDERYMVHVVVREGQSELLGGTLLPPAVAARIGCDCSSVEHLVGERGEPLALGRKTKQWNTAQRRAILVRDGGRCRFPGCENRSVDVHHHRWWTRGGATDVSNGWSACPRHHTLVHEGYAVTGDPNGELTFHRRDGGVVGTTTPRTPPGWVRLAA